MEDDKTTTKKMEENHTNMEENHTKMEEDLTKMEDDLKENWKTT
jgi:hypothetical protein